MIFIIAAALIKGFVIDPANGRIPAGEIIRLNDQWDSVVSREGESEIGEETGQYTEYTYVIPDGVSRNLIFSMTNPWESFRILLDGKEIYSWNDTYKELGTRRHWIELPEDSSGKELVIQIDGHNSFADWNMGSPAYLGEKNAVLMEFLSSEFYALFFFMITVILAFLIWICQKSLRSRLSAGNLRKIRYLTLFILDIGVWVLTDSQIMQFFAERTAVIELVSFISFLVMPLLVFPLIREMMVYPWKIFDILYKISIVITILILCTYLFRIAPIYTFLFLQHIMILAAIPVTVKTGITEIKKYKNREMKKMLLGFGLLSLSIIGAIATFYVSNAPRYAYVYIAGFLMFMLCLAWAVFDGVYQHLEESTKISLYKKMAYMDGMTGMENRSAFEYMLEQEIPAKGVAYVLFDNNNLKNINDNYGHQAGDRLLEETAACIREIFGPLGRCFRIGGDEFLVVLREMSEDAVKELLKYFDHKLEEANQKRGIAMEIAYGYFVCGDASMTTEELFKRADESMYLKKQEMKGK